ncbi:MAG: DNA polymerase IV [Thaumarchaeota archaeon]|nr:DNA polymerase IV [Nitrososphaerota archaeon]
MSRVVGHFDLDYFYAQVEEVEDPSLRQRPVVVCVFSGRTEDSGVVSTANYIAREWGVTSGMPITTAKEKLQDKNPAIVRMNHGKYELVSDRVMDTLSQHVDILEQTGIDEAFFDVTATTGGDFSLANRVAHNLKDLVLENHGLTCSVGLGRSKAVAKLGSELAKPGGTTITTSESTENFLGPLEVSRLYGVGPKTLSILMTMQIKTIGELAKFDPLQLESRLGRKLSSYLLAASTGSDTDPVVAGQAATQYSRIITLKHDTKDPQVVLDQLSAGIDSVHNKLSESNKSFRTLSAIGILTDLTSHTKSKTFEVPINDAFSMKEGVLSLFEELSQSVGKDFRRAGVRVSGLYDIEDQKSLSDFLQSG